MYLHSPAPNAHSGPSPANHNVLLEPTSTRTLQLPNSLQSMQVTVRLPGDKLAAVNHLGQFQSVWLGPGGHAHARVCQWMGCKAECGVG